ncbi:hypothetical protein PspLS_03205 [Pyricularia sp. CBS 133598]|nr:hypothetical protein PspLS_03205 [Pyricularia sp. CBS 133598]
MPSFNPFSAVTGRHAFSLFDIRLENDFLVFRGNEHEAASQLLKGVLAVCVPGPTKIEDIHLRLIGTLRLSWADTKATPSGISIQKFEKTTEILSHRWPSFIGTPGKSMILDKGNYEFPFELMLPGNTSESVEGLKEASITYRLKATIARGKLAYDHHAYKHIRMIRTLDASALEFLHAMSVENIWPNKVEYSIVVPRKAVVFGSAIPFESRFTPLLKGLEIGDVTIRLIEACEILATSATGVPIKEHKKEREVTSWVLPVTRDEHWQDVIENTGQEGWVLTADLDLPRKLGKCVQDVNTHGIKTRHKLKIVVALQNPDGHISELRATLPVTIFISPNIPLDEEGNLAQPVQQNSSSQESTSQIAPPGYGEHVLDQLYSNIDMAGYQTPGVQSGMNSPYMALSRAGSNENLAAMLNDNTITPAALTSRLQDVSVAGNPPHRDSSYASLASALLPSQNADTTPANTSPPASAPLSRHDSGEENHSGNQTPEHVDFPELSELSKVPSYATAIRSSRVFAPAVNALPDYATATSEPTTPAVTTPVMTPVAQTANPLELIPEDPLEQTGARSVSPAATPASPTNMSTSADQHHNHHHPQRPTPRRHSSFGGFFSSHHSLGMHHFHHHHGEGDERRRFTLMQMRDPVS